MVSKVLTLLLLGLANAGNYDPTNFKKPGTKGMPRSMDHVDMNDATQIYLKRSVVTDLSKGTRPHFYADMSIGGGGST